MIEMRMRANAHNNWVTAFAAFPGEPPYALIWWVSSARKRQRTRIALFYRDGK